MLERSLILTTIRRLINIVLADFPLLANATYFPPCNAAFFLGQEALLDKTPLQVLDCESTDEISGVDRQAARRELALEVEKEIDTRRGLGIRDSLRSSSRRITWSRRLPADRIKEQ